jgi:hypothetical protein
MATTLPRVHVTLTGHLTRDALEEALDGATRRLGQDFHQVALIVDCRTMTGYDADARALFASWNARFRSRINRVAVITEKVLWHMVVAAMAVASGQRMKAFDSMEAADAWLGKSG